MRPNVARVWTGTLLPQKSSLRAQAAAILEERIRSGEWRKWLPGEHELCGQLRIARMTLRRALAQLEEAGLVRAQQGRRREIVVRRRRVARQVCGRVLLLTPMALHFLPPSDMLWVGELRGALEKVGFHFEVHAERGLYLRGCRAGLERLLIRQWRPAGCVLLYSTQQMQGWFSQHRFPCVIVGSRHSGVEVPSVDKAQRAVCRHAVGLFLARGHRRVVLLNPASGAAGDLESEEGFREGIAEGKSAGVEGLVVRHDGTVRDICGKLDGLPWREARPVCLLVSRAVNVLTVMGHLMRRGLRLPEDVALISRDHEPFLEQMVPSVARYVVRPDSMARRISRAVLEMVQSGLVSAANYQIVPTFTEGETLGPKLVSAPAAEQRGSR